MRPLGHGGMGEVFEARDTRLDRRVAIKTLRPELLADPRSRRRFEREAKALSGLSHPNVCTVFDVGRDQEVDFIVMEYIEGDTLAALLDRGTLDEPATVRYAGQIAEALAEAHERGVLHRDIKPQNVMITPRGQVKVLDFGLAKAMATDPADAATVSGFSDAGAVVGTAPYMSPEQVRGEPVDARSDVFSLGSVIYEAVAGCAPFRAPTAAETMSAILTRDPVPLARAAPQTTPELQRIVRKCLDKDRTRRYQTVRDVATDLENLRRDSAGITAPSIDIGPGAYRPLPPRMVIAGVALALVIVAAALAVRAGVWRPAGVPAIGSIAVLPFKPLSTGVSENYLGLGIADGLITRLSGRPELTVRPTSAVRRYAGEEADAVSAGAELKVEAVLEGTWQRDADRIRVSVNLLRVADGRSMWVDRFDFPVSDVFLIQDRVSDELASRLRLELDTDNRTRVDASRPGTGSPDAYEAYLRGQFYLGIRSYDPNNRQTTDKAIEFLERAVALDANYAEAHAKLGLAYAHAAMFLEDNPALIERAKRETDRAEALRPGLGQVELNRALIWWSWYEGWRIVDSIRAYRRAAELDPALSDIELAAGYAHLGLLNEWRRAGEGVIERDPTNRNARSTFVNEHFLLNLPDQGIAAQKRLLNQEPDERYFLLTRRIAEATPMVEGRAARSPGDVWAQVDLALLRALQGRHREADAIVSRALKAVVKNRGYHHFTYELAQVYGLAGNADAAARWLEETINWGFPCYPLFSTDSFLDPVRDAPRVKRVLSDLKVTWERYRDALQ
ncbi:MAG TPA: protein kinase [Vicinamibacterales bacterium]|nr:protein kinase [Vicinamibacterales bacterium]